MLGDGSGRDVVDQGPILFGQFDVSGADAAGQLVGSTRPHDGAIHGLSISEDGTRGYLADLGKNGLTIVDTSQIQDRKPSPQMPVNVVAAVMAPLSSPCANGP